MSDVRAERSGPTVAQFRADLCAWIETHLDELRPPPSPAGDVVAELTHQRHVQAMLFDAGWMRWGWPPDAGGLGGSPLLRAVLGEELTSRALVHTTSWSMHEVLGPAVLTYGRSDVVNALFPRLLRGDEFWCQGFSEPEAGSDLAGLRTTARRTSSGWTVTGEKLWTSWGHHATRCVVLARTGEASSRARGISAFLVDMDTPGVSARPLRTMAEVDEFSATSFVDVAVPAERLLGEEGDGWALAQRVLACERGAIFWQRGAWLAHHLEVLVAQSTGRDAAAIGEAYQVLHAFRSRSWSTQHTLARDGVIGPEASVDKILVAQAEQAVFDAARELLDGGLELGDGDTADRWRREWAYSRAATIYGGTSEIQKDIVSTRVLGLPRGAA
ncbi:MAG TPA: acyl-CoA dehydrogenase family protein [Mycobacteriales bacterium]|nr:acyl-CoA dehydrogenase family protein [Mycobacteriales bacterium]